MKSEYKNPEISIAEFQTDSIVTDSNTAAESIKTEFAQSYGDVSKVIEWKW